MVLGFFGGTGAKNLPCNAGDMGWIPSLERSQCFRATKPYAPQLLSPGSSACEQQLLKPVCLDLVLCNKRSHCKRGLAHCNQE